MSILLPHLNKLKILHKQKLAIVPFELNQPQAFYLDRVEAQLRERQRVRCIILKARQMGFSTLTEGLGFLFSFMVPSYRVEVIGHETDASANLLALSNRFWTHWWARDLYSTKHLATNRLAWVETESQFHVSTASGKGAGRSSTIHFLHASEVAFWPNPEETFLGLMQTVPEADKTFVALESTANGVGNFFYNKWVECITESRPDFEPLFFPWFQDPTYRASVAKIDWDLPKRLSDDELTLIKVFGVDEDQLKWRRHFIANKCNNDVLKFCQEYPATWQEAFLSSGSNQFAVGALNKCYEPIDPDTGFLIDSPRGIKFVRDPTGPLKLFVYPPGYNADTGMFDRGRCPNNYFIGADTCRSKTGDFAVCQVINRRTAEQVAVFRQQMLPLELARQLLLLGQFFGDAMIAPERANEGHLVIGFLLGASYPYMWMHEKIDSLRGKPNADMFGFDTNVQTKPQLIGMLQDYVATGPTSFGGLLIHDAVTFIELQNFIRYDNGDYGPADEKHGHDDTVMALAIALFCNYLEPAPTQRNNDIQTRDLAPAINRMMETGDIDEDLYNLLYGDRGDQLAGVGV